MAQHRIFLLSPAHAAGQRTAMLLRPGASFELARNLQIGSATLGEVFTFCSGLYFRGKMAYSHRFAAPPAGQEGVLVITPSRGLLPPGEWVNPAMLAEFAQVDIQAGGARFAEPLIASATALANLSAEVVLLGSIATSKYVDVLLPILGEKLLFPSDFVGRGDMSRGALMLRAARHGHELPCIPVLGAIRKGRRAPSMITMELRRSPSSPAPRRNAHIRRPQK